MIVNRNCVTYRLTKIVSVDELLKKNEQHRKIARVGHRC